MTYRDYREEKPPSEGWYKWRLPHPRLEGVTLVFLAKFRERGAGFEKVLSPDFDYWDGYRVLLPKGSIEWTEYAGSPPHTGSRLLDVDGCDLAKCPFCKETPAWRYSGGHVTAGPLYSEYYHLECCSWANTVRMTNPLHLAAKRNELLAS